MGFCKDILHTVTSKSVVRGLVDDWAAQEHVPHGTCPTQRDWAAQEHVPHGTCPIQRDWFEVALEREGETEQIWVKKSDIFRKEILFLIIFSDQEILRLFFFFNNIVRWQLGYAWRRP